MGAKGARVGTGNDFFDFIKPSLSQKISFTASSSQSSAFASTTTVVQLFASEDCWCRMGSNPTAAANDGNSFFIPGGMVVFYVVNPSEKIAVIKDSVNGHLHIIEAESNA